MIPVAPLEGLAAETLLFFVPALCYLLYRGWTRQSGLLSPELGQRAGGRI